MQCTPSKEKLVKKEIERKKGVSVQIIRLSKYTCMDTYKKYQKTAAAAAAGVFDKEQGRPKEKKNHTKKKRKTWRRYGNTVSARGQEGRAFTTYHLLS